MSTVLLIVPSSSFIISLSGGVSVLTVLLTGAMGAGKSSSADFLEEQPYPVFRADAQARELLKPSSPCFQSLKLLFKANGLFDLRGGIDHKKLAHEIFTYPEKRKALEDIVHPLVRQSFQLFVQNQKKQGKDKVFYEAPLLSREIFRSCDKSILLVCPEKIRKNRLIKAGWREEELDQRWAAQIPEKDIRGMADFTLDNSAELKKLHAKLRKILLVLKNEKEV